MVRACAQNDHAGVKRGAGFGIEILPAQCAHGLFAVLAAVTEGGLVAIRIHAHLPPGQRGLFLQLHDLAFQREHIPVGAGQILVFGAFLAEQQAFAQAQIVDAGGNTAAQHQVQRGRIAAAHHLQRVPGCLPGFSGQLGQQLHFFLVRLNKGKTGQIHAQAIQLGPGQCVHPGCHPQQLVVIHIAFADIAQVRHQDHLMLFPQLFGLGGHGLDHLPFRMQRGIGIAGGFGGTAEHGRANEPFFGRQ